jgi:hypothetical protein
MMSLGVPFSKTPDEEPPSMVAAAASARVGEGLLCAGRLS